MFRILTTLLLLTSISLTAHGNFGKGHPHPHFLYSTTEVALQACIDHEDRPAGAGCRIGGGFSYYTWLNGRHSTNIFGWINCYPPNEIFPYEGVEAGTPNIICIPPQPNLVSFLDFEETNPQLRVGAKFELDVAAIRNKGAGAMEATTAGLYISTDTVFDAGDIRLTDSLGVPPLGGGILYEFPDSELDFRVPRLPEGNYYLLLIANLGQKAEANHDDNLDIEPFTIKEEFPNLVSTLEPLQQVPGPIEVYPGQTLDVNVGVKNKSTSVAYDEAFSLAVFRSKEATPKADDFPFNIATIPSLSPEADRFFETGITIPESTASGEWNLVAVANPTGFFSGQSDPEEADFEDNASLPVKFDVILPKVEIEICVGNPISTSSGRKFETEVDYQGVGPFPLHYLRHYSSRPGNSKGWSHSYSRHLFISENDSTTDVILVRDGGQRYEFIDIDNHGYSDPDVPGFIRRAPAGFDYLDDAGTTHHFDEDGRLSGLTSITGFVQTLSYTDGVLTTITDQFGKSISLSHDTVGQIVAMTTPEGHGYGYEYDNNGLLVIVTLPDATPTNLSDNPTRQYVYESTNLEHGLTGVIDENGNRFSTFDYDEEGRAILSTHHDNADRNTISYGENEATVTNALGKDTTYFFEKILGSKRLTRVEGHPTTNCLATTTTRSYDARGSVTAEVDKNGNITRYSHTHSGLSDDQYSYHVGLVSSRTEAFGTVEERTTAIQWHPDFRLPIAIEEPGRRIELTYDSYARLTSRTEIALDTGSERIWTNTYNETGLLTQINGPRTDVQDTTMFAYNYDGELNSITNALGHTTTITAHDDNGLPSEVVDPNGLVTQLEYDARLRLIGQRTISVEGTATTSIGYDAKGNVSAVTLPDGQTLGYDYDLADRLISITNDLGETITFEVDADGNRTTEITHDAGGDIVRVQERAFDELSRLITSLGAVSQTTRFSYDKNDNLEFIEDALGRQTTLSFDALDRLIKITDALQGESTFSYDTSNNLTSVTDAEGVMTTFEYDGHRNLLKEISTARGTTTYNFDAAGNRTDSSDANGVLSTMAYDALNRLTHITYRASPDENIEYSYDQGEDSIGQLTGLVDESGSTTFEYDDRSNLVRDTRIIGGREYMTSYRYDLANQLTEMIYPSGRIVSYQLDQLSRVVRVTTRANGASPEEVIAEGISYLPYGPATDWTHGNNLETSISYDQDFRVTSINVQVSPENTNAIMTRSYGYDAASNILSILDGIGTDSQIFQYDQLNRLSGASGEYGDIDYNYDAVGNRLTRTIEKDGDGEHEAYTYQSQSHRLNSVTTTSSDSVETRTLTQDAAGNTVTDSSNDQSITMQVNAANRLTSVSNEGTVQGAYQYNALGQRVAKQYTYRGRIHAHFDSSGSSSNRNNGKGKAKANSRKADTDKLHVTVDNKKVDETLHFHYDQMGNLIAESDTEGTAFREYIYLGNYRIAMTATSLEQGAPQPNLKEPLALYFLHNDHLGTTSLVTDSEGRTVWQARQTPFGEIELLTEGLRMPMRFPGQYADPESGYSYNYFRDYDPTLGRYIQSDPIGLAGGINPLVYALLSPKMFSDKQGLCPICLPLVGAIIGGVNGYAGVMATGGSDTEARAAAVYGALVGAASTTIKAGFAIGGLVGAVSNFAGQLLNNEVNGNASGDISIDLAQVATAAIVSSLTFGVAVKFPESIALALISGQYQFAIETSVKGVCDSL
ncbi:MAG: RHS repeat protein [Gammaproteobacteria bacterium]|nr:RHS repeat protein [Gammaproteobacteria bacterium]MBT4493787.1 RHS repeat protein [Gammaproteobacteria bacterium]MBT7369208.1 RHS repeat protein [Gammaproteobacteria bacterium]